MKRFCVFLAVGILAMMSLTGCLNRQAALSKATMPIASQIHEDMDDYIGDLDPGAAQDLQFETNAKFLTACEVGDRLKIVESWFGEEAIRTWYLDYLAADPKYEQPWGTNVRQMKISNVHVFDFVVSIGEPPPRE